jgi:hypothetical protein
MPRRHLQHPLPQVEGEIPKANTSPSASRMCWYRSLLLLARRVSRLHFTRLEWIVRLPALQDLPRPGTPLGILEQGVLWCFRLFWTGDENEEKMVGLFPVSFYWEACLLERFSPRSALLGFYASSVYRVPTTPLGRSTLLDGPPKPKRDSYIGA